MNFEESHSTISVLVVTADAAFAAACENSLAEHGDFTIHTASTVGEALALLETDTPIDCLISDHDLPDTDGIAFLATVRAQTPTLPFILFTSDGSESVASRAISAGVTEYLIKGVHSDQWDRLATLIEDSITYSRDQDEIANTESRARVLLDAAKEIIGVVRDGKFAYLNEAGLEYWGRDSRTAAVGTSVSEILTTDGITAIEAQIAAVQAGASTLDSLEGQLITADSTLHPVEITATRITWGDVPAVLLVIRDISERRERKHELTLKNRTIDEAPVGITISDARQDDTPILYVNTEFERLTGYSKTEVLGRNCRFLQGDATAPEPVAAMREAIAAEEPVTVELRNYRKDRTEFWNRVTIAPIRNDAGEVTHYLGFQEDVSERIKYEQMLRRFRRAVEAAGHAIYITDPDGMITYVNPAFERITGYESDEVVGRTPTVLNSGEMSAEYFDDLWTTISAGDVWREEIQDRRKSGELYYASQTIAPITSQDGEIEAYVAIQTDITAQKEREDQLRQYERAIEGASELITAVDDEYQYLFANETYREFHDITRETITETTLPEVVGDDTFETVEPYIERAFDGQVVEYRMSRGRPDRPDRTFAIRYYPLEDETGTVWAVVATMRDLTEQLEREYQLASLDRLLRHNLRNELNVVLGQAELIEQEAPDEIAALAAPIVESAERVLTQGDKEREIVELLAEPSDPETFNLAEMVAAVVETVQTAHPDAEIYTEVPAALELTAIPEVRRALEEVIENAVVHTDQKPSTVEITVRQTTKTVEIRVADNGSEIPPEERAVISEDMDIDALTHSSGMGLWLVKRIISRASGTLRFEDSDAHGTVITLAFPTRETTE